MSRKTDEERRRFPGPLQVRSVGCPHGIAARAPPGIAAPARLRENGGVASDSLKRLRRICLALPEATERQSHGEPSWFVRDKKLFVTMSDHHHDDRVAFWCAAPEGAQEELVAADPEHFFRPPYVGGRGWLGVYLDVDVDWDEIQALVTDAYRQVAPKSLVASLETDSG